MTIFVPGKLRNPLNGSWGGWRKHARLAKDWRERTAQHIFAEKGQWTIDARTPKRIIFMAQVGSLWDDDNLPAAIKPIRDALQGTVIVADDATHEFIYKQVVDRKHRGVTVTVEPRA
jgi:hypothetical protein